MKRYHFAFFSLLFLLAACGGKKQTTISENDIDAARNFIRSALDGKFDEARQMIVDDSDNVHYLDNAERIYKGMNPDAINSYRSSSINVHQVTALNDSTTVVIYSNSFKNDHDTLKVVKGNGQWLVDLKYLFEHDANSTTTKPILNDSLQ